jgi:hypothetical protein
MKSLYTIIIYMPVVQNPDTHLFQGSDPDPQFFRGRIRIRIKIVWIRNTAINCSFYTFLCGENKRFFILF